MKRHITHLAHWAWQQTEQASFRKLAKITAGLLLLVVAVPLLVDASARLAYRSSSYDMAQRIWRVGQVLTWYDRDVPAYNAGTAYYRLANWTPAIDQYEASLKLAPESRQCAVRWNLALALNQRGDEGARTTQENAAIGDYTRAVSILEYPSCADDPAFDELRDAISQKLAALIERINQQNSRPNYNTQKPEDNPPETDEQEADEQAKRQREYRNSVNDSRYREQSDEEITQGYQNKAW